MNTLAREAASIDRKQSFLDTAIAWMRGKWRNVRNSMNEPETDEERDFLGHW